MKKYLVKIEFRYKDAPKNGYNFTGHNKTMTIGVYDNFEDACSEGNKLLELLESKFPLHQYPDGSYAKKLRFGQDYAYSKLTLVSPLAYLKTPFDFYAKIETLDHSPIDVVIDDVVSATKRYRDYKLRERDDD